jgi:hypothetical protein
MPFAVKLSDIPVVLSLDLRSMSAVKNEQDRKQLGCCVLGARRSLALPNAQFRIFEEQF